MIQNDLDRQLLSMFSVTSDTLCPSQSPIDALRMLSMQHIPPSEREYLSFEILGNEAGVEQEWEVGSLSTFFRHKDMGMAVSAALVNIATRMDEEQINKLFGTTSY